MHPHYLHGVHPHLDRSLCPLMVGGGGDMLGEVAEDVTNGGEPVLNVGPDLEIKQNINIRLITKLSKRPVQCRCLPD